MDEAIETRPHRIASFAGWAETARSGAFFLEAIGQFLDAEAFRGVVAWQGRRASPRPGRPG